MNIETGEQRELSCEVETAQVEVEAIVAAHSDVLVVYFCADLGAPRTMIQSLVTDPNGSAVWMGIAGSSPAAVAYSSAADAILMVTGACKGLLVYQFESAASIEGTATPVTSIRVGDYRYELDGGRGFGDSPPCTELGAVRGLGASDDGSVVVLALAEPDDQYVDGRLADVFVGEVELQSGDGGLVLDADMTSVADDLDELYPSIGVAACGSPSAIVVSAGGKLQVLEAGERRTLPLVSPVRSGWGGLALSADGESIMVLTEVDFEPGDLYEADALHLC